MGRVGVFFCAVLIAVVAIVGWHAVTLAPWWVLGEERALLLVDRHGSSMLAGFLTGVAACVLQLVRALRAEHSLLPSSLIASAVSTVVSFAVDVAAADGFAGAALLTAFAGAVVWGAGFHLGAFVFLWVWRALLPFAAAPGG